MLEALLSCPSLPAYGELKRRILLPVKEALRGHRFWRPYSHVLACRPRGTKEEGYPTCERSLERPPILEALLSCPTLPDPGNS